jgi:hypothetical protein
MCLNFDFCLSLIVLTRPPIFHLTFTQDELEAELRQLEDDLLNEEMAKLPSVPQTTLHTHAAGEDFFSHNSTYFFTLFVFISDLSFFFTAEEDEFARLEASMVL